MQPYFFPYVGYYRLLAAVDLFVILDCVQFPRRGRVHRCEVLGPTGQTEWLTLPLARQDRAIRIRDLEFAESAQIEMQRRLARHRWIADPTGPVPTLIRDTLSIRDERVIDYLDQQIKKTAALLGITPAICRSTEFCIEEGLRGQDRIVAICTATGADTYINPPGGRRFYSESAFRSAGLNLRFLSPWQGAGTSILHDLLRRDLADIAREIRAGIANEAT